MESADSVLENPTEEALCRHTSQEIDPQPGSLTTARKFWLGIGIFLGIFCSVSLAETHVRVYSRSDSLAVLSSAPGASFRVGWTGRCGNILCTMGHTCCPGVNGYVCVGPGGSCCQGRSGSIACGPLSSCNFNAGGNAYCCGFGSLGVNNACFTHPFACFPGEASVFVEGKGILPIRELHRGDSVLVRQHSGKLMSEPVLGHLHVWQGEVMDEASFLTVRHARGLFRASPNHLVFTVDGDKRVSEVKPGDRLFLAPVAAATLRGLFQPVAVLGVESEARSRDMYAPFTASGTIVVDGILASNYATHSLDDHLRHATIHAFLFPVRAYYALRLTKPFGLFCKIACHIGVCHHQGGLCVAETGVVHHNGTEQFYPFVDFVRDYAITAERFLFSLTS